MATIDLITYDQKMVTPKDDALIHQFGISNGVLYGCDVTLADSNTLHITGGQGVIYGRQWEITEGDITVTLPASGSLKGRLYVKIDLSNTTNPIELLVQTDVTLPDLTDDDQINVNNSVSELELYTFDVSSLTISNLVKTVETVADGDHADVVQMQNDISQLNSSLTSKVTLKEFHSTNVTLYTDTDYTDYHYIFTQTYTNTPRVVLDILTSTTTRNNIPIAVIQALSMTSVIVRVWKQVGVTNTSQHNVMANPQLNIAVFGN